MFADEDFRMEYLYKQSDFSFELTFDLQKINWYVDDVLKLQIPDSVDSGVYLEDELQGVEGILEGDGSIDSDDPKPSAADSETVRR